MCSVILTPTVKEHTESTEREIQMQQAHEELASINPHLEAQLHYLERDEVCFYVIEDITLKQAPRDEAKFFFGGEDSWSLVLYTSTHRPA